MDSQLRICPELSASAQLLLLWPSAEENCMFSPSSIHTKNNSTNTGIPCRSGSVVYRAVRRGN